MRIRLRYAVFGLALVAFFIVLALEVSRPPATAPRFIPLHSQPVGTYVRMDYDWGGAVPVRDGKVWITAYSTGTNWHFYLYDLTNRLVVGELFNAAPIFFDQDQTKLLCEADSVEGAWRWKSYRWLKNFAFTKGWAKRINMVEAFVVLDLKSGEAKRIGKVFQSQGFGSRFLPSPGFRYGVNQPSAGLVRNELFLCDLASNLFTKIKVSGELLGWWDEHTLLIKDGGNNFVRQDVTSGRTSTLFSADAISGLLDKMDLPKEPGDLGTVLNWNGRDYDIYFTLASQKGTGQAFLTKLDRSNHTLKLIKRDFKFCHLGRLDADATHYLYQGERGASGTGGNGAVYLRNLSDDSVQTLVAPDNGGQYSLARFCGDGVLYWHNKLVWRVGLNGSNNAPLFQPSGGFQLIR